MKSGQVIRIAALVARPAGLATLRGLMRSHLAVEWAGVFTHRRLPRCEDPHRSERPEFGAYVAFAETHGVPVTAIDSRCEAEHMPGLARCRPFDVLLSVNWRYRVPAEMLTWAAVGAINLHRGRLPDYAGAEPVRRALEAGETHVSLTAHEMTAELDAGPILVERIVPAGRLCGPRLVDDVERIKRKLVPLYPQMAAEAIEEVCRRAAVGV